MICGGVGRDVRTQHDERLADLAEPLVGNADDRGLRDRRVLAQHLLDLGGVAVEAADDEHVLAAIRDAQEALLVEHADVAGVQPAVGVDRLGRRGGILEVADA